MVVICGETIVDSSVPEKPATNISSGTRLPKARSRFCAPIAKVSVKAKTASNSTLLYIRRSIASAPSFIAIDVKNIEDLFQVVKEAGIYKMQDQQVNGLPFWENGVKFFTIEGPNKEKIEFCEKL